MTAARRPRVHHLGRAGEVAGGMTQVLNGYLQWRFDEVDVVVITTRGDPGDHQAGARAAAAAAGAIARLPRHDVVVAHLSEGGSFLREGLLLRLARRRGLGTVAHLHGASFAEFAAMHPRLAGLALGAADRVISLSEESSDVAARFVPDQRIDLIPNAIPGSLPVPAQRVVVFGGVVGPRKGVDVLLSAWESAGAATEGWTLRIAGPVVDPAVVRQVPGVEFLGRLDHEALMGLLDEASIAVLPSREEAMPMFVLEAMARRNCVIATTVGGVVPVLDGRGLLVPPADVPALTAALEQALGDEALRMRLAAAALTAFERTYSAAAVFPRLEALWLRARRDATGKASARRERRVMRAWMEGR